MNSNDGKIEIDPQEYNDNPFYALRGRLGRARFLAYMLLFNSLLFGFLLLIKLLLSILSPDVVDYLQSEKNEKLRIFSFFSILIVGNFFLIKRRFNDLDHSGWMVFIFLIPYINILLSLYLIYSSGNKGLNYFGYPAKPPKKWHKILAIIFATVLMILHFYWFMFYVMIL